MKTENDFEKEPIPGDRFFIALTVTMLLVVGYFGLRELGLKTTVTLLAPFALAMVLIFALVRWIDPPCKSNTEDEDSQ